MPGHDVHDRDRKSSKGIHGRILTLNNISGGLDKTRYRESMRASGGRCGKYQLRYALDPARMHQGSVSPKGRHNDAGKPLERRNSIPQEKIALGKKNRLQR